jgi:hypothetical protein
MRKIVSLLLILAMVTFAIVGWLVSIIVRKNHPRTLNGK